MLRSEPEHPQGWRWLGDALTVGGDAQGAAAAYMRHLGLSVRDPAMQHAALALSSNQLDVAERQLRTILRDRPTEVAAIRMLAELAARIDRLADAENLLDRALELTPGFAAARHNRAIVRHRRGRGAAALADMTLLLKDEPDNPAYLATYAAALSRTGEYETAVAVYDRLLAQSVAGGDARLWLSKGHALKTLGWREDCIAAYRRAIALDPGLGEAWWSLANLKTYRFTEDETGQISSLLRAEGIADNDRMHLHFALGPVLEATGDHARAFDHYCKANALRRSTLPYDPQGVAAHVDDVIRYFTPEFVAAKGGQGALGDDPVFVVGLPRSGSTLIEQILASHPSVEGTMELSNIVTIAGELGSGRDSDGGYMARLARLDRTGLRALGERYLRETRIHRREGTPLFIDKMPNNWMHVALIHLILPNARIVDARRHPLDCALSCFGQHFARGQAFSNDLADLGHYYANYVRLMDHVDTVAPGRVHRVFHEQLVAEPETNIRALLEACGLAYDPACLVFHQNARPVRTASAEQVREPLSAKGIGRWRRFDPWLEPLREALGVALTSYPRIDLHD